MKLLLFVIALVVAAPLRAQQTFSSHRTYLGSVAEGLSMTVTASFFDSSPTPQPINPDVVDCGVWKKGVDPKVTAPLFSCSTINDPGVADVALELSPLATQVVDPDATSTERHYIKVLGQADGKFIPIEGEFDVVSDPAVAVDPDTGIPGLVVPSTPTPGP